MQMLLVFFLFSKFSFFELRLANFSRFLNGNFPENAPRFLLFSKRDMPADAMIRRRRILLLWMGKNTPPD